MIIKIDPVAKPRMTQRDKWQKRPSVMKYRAFCDELRRQAGIIEWDTYNITFWIPMPPSWPKKKKAEMNNKPHQQRYDLDNCVKAVLDALNDEDSAIWSIYTRKFWAYEGRIELTEGE